MSLCNVVRVHHNWWAYFLLRFLQLFFKKLNDFDKYTSQKIYMVHVLDLKNLNIIMF